MASDKLGSFRFAIEGYADPRGVSATNLKLSQARAESVRDYLVRGKHIDPARLEPIGKGDRELMNKVNPIAPENRRVTIVNISK
jgi:outer membrane protein OmpA-like peptidoglycan-associated protein